MSCPFQVNPRLTVAHERRLEAARNSVTCREFVVVRTTAVDAKSLIQESAHERNLEATGAAETALPRLRHYAASAAETVAPRCFLTNEPHLEKKR